MQNTVCALRCTKRLLAVGALDQKCLLSRRPYSTANTIHRRWNNNQRWHISAANSLSKAVLQNTCCQRLVNKSLRNYAKVQVRGISGSPSWSIKPCERPFDFRDKKKPQRVVSTIGQDIPFLNQSYRLNLACSLAQLLEDGGVKTLLWGDILHYIHGGKDTLPHEYSYIVKDKNLLSAHEIFQYAGLQRCELPKCYLNYRDDNIDLPAVHYHIERPPNCWPFFTEFREEEIPNDSNLAFEELETIRLYRLEDTLWEIKSLDLRCLCGGPENVDVEDAGDNEEWTRTGKWVRKADKRWPPDWPLVRIPTAPRYIEALLLHWVRSKDTANELKWWFKIFDLLMSEDGHEHIYKCMEPGCRHVMETLHDQIAGDQEDTFFNEVIIRDILSQAERLLWKRAASQRFWDKFQDDYDYSRQFISPRKKAAWLTQKRCWEQQLAPGPDDEVDAGSPPLPKKIMDRIRVLRKEFGMQAYIEIPDPVDRSPRKHPFWS